MFQRPAPRRLILKGVAGHIQFGTVYLPLGDETCLESAKSTGWQGDGHEASGEYSRCWLSG